MFMVNMNLNVIRNILMVIFIVLYDIFWKLNIKMVKLMNFLFVYVLNIFKEIKMVLFFKYVYF